jgi:glyoxylase-like metal-dependent hydrolase (beta-lactamase superfamily II)
LRTPSPDSSTSGFGLDALTAIPFVKDFAFRYGEAARLSPFVRRVIANNPGPFTFTGSGTYIVGADEGPVFVIDPGPMRAEHLGALEAAIGGAEVAGVLITHTHSDHCGGAKDFAARVKAPIYGAGPHPVADKAHDAPALDEGADYAFKPDILLADGEKVCMQSIELTAIATPGHLSNHLCFALAAEKALFTGDHIMGWATTVVAPPDGDMGAYLESLEKLLARDDAIYYPTHGAPILNPKPFVRAVRTHRRIRDGQILDQLRKGRTRIKEITAAIYVDIDRRLHGAAALNVYAHLIRLEREGVVACEGRPTLDGDYRLVDGAASNAS